MTPNKVIEMVDRLKANAYSEEEKFGWLNELDGMIQRTVMKIDEPVSMTYPDDMDTDLLVGFPFESIYGMYMEAMIDFHNKEFGNYNNSVLMFNERFDEYKKAYIRETIPKTAGNFKNIMG